MSVGCICLNGLKYRRQMRATGIQIFIFLKLEKTRQLIMQWLLKVQFQALKLASCYRTLPVILIMKNAPLFFKTIIFKFLETTELNMPFSEVIRRYLYFLEYALSHANAKTWLQITFNEKLKSLKISHYLFKSFVSYLPAKFLFSSQKHTINC